MTSWQQSTLFPAIKATPKSRERRQATRLAMMIVDFAIVRTLFVAVVARFLIDFASDCRVADAYRGDQNRWYATADQTIRTTMRLMKTAAEPRSLARPDNS